MTPKEKAQELVELFSFNCRECDNAKLSALLAVDEILGQFRWRPSDGLSYWTEVKQEIENL